MTKKTPGTSKFILLGFAIILVPSVMLLIMDRFERNSFRELLTMDRAECVRAAGDDDRVKEICLQSALLAEDAYLSSRDTVWVTRTLLLAIIYVLSIGVVSLKSQMNELKESLDV